MSWDTDIVDTQSSQYEKFACEFKSKSCLSNFCDYLNDILPGVDIDEIRKQNIDGSYLWGDLPYDLGEDVRILNLEVASILISLMETF